MNKLRKSLGKAASVLKYAVLTVLVVALLWGVIILRQINQPTDLITPDTSQLPLTPSKDVEIASEGQLGELLSSFPVPAMCMLTGSGAVLTSGSCADFPLNEGVGRKLTVTYSLDEGSTLRVVSVYPATSWQETDTAGCTLTGDTGFTLAGVPSSRWEGKGMQLLTCQSKEAVYAVYYYGAGQIPESVVQSLQLFTAEKSNENNPEE